MLKLSSPARPLRLAIVALALVGATGCGPSMTRVEQVAGSCQIDAEAPVIVHLQQEIAAPPARVWALLTGAQAWSAWEPDISGVEPRQPLTAGERFVWKAGGTTLHSTVQCFEPEHRVVWTGQVFTAKAIHGWTLTPAAAGHTRVVVDESMDGPLMAVLMPAKKLSAADDAWLQALRRAAERP